MPTPTGFTSIYTSTEIDDAIGAVQTKADKSTTTTAGTYKSVTVNSSGIVTGGSNPTTIAGYGITDAYTKVENNSNFYALKGGTELSPSSSNLVDLDNITSTGSYYSEVSADSQYVSNKPTTSNTAFRMWVSASNGTGYMRQRFQYYNEEAIYERHSTTQAGGTWTSWVLVQDNLESYLPLSGGTLTGALVVNSTIAASDSFTINNDIATINLNSISGASTGAYKTQIINNHNWSNPMNCYGGSTGAVNFMGFRNGGNFCIMPAGGTANVGWSSNISNLNVTGEVTHSSDARLKSIVEDIELSINDIALAPSIRYRWKDNGDNNIHIGSIAQYWHKILPESVHINEDNYMSLNYETSSLCSVIAVAREVKKLEEENVQLKKEIAEIKEMLKKLL